MWSTRNLPKSTTTRRSLLEAGDGHDPHVKERVSGVSMGEGHFSFSQGLQVSLQRFEMKTKFGRV
jgi:hypothetical protein